MTDAAEGSLCAEVEAHLDELVDGTAPAELYEHLAECDACRDARHDAEAARALASAAGLDHRTPDDLEARLFAALERDRVTAEHVPNESGAATQNAERARERARPEALDGARREPRPTRKSETAEQSGRQRRTRESARGERRLTTAVLVLAFAAAVALAWQRGKQHAAGGGDGFSATLERAASATGSARVLACASDGSRCKPIDPGATLAGQVRLKTDGTTRAELRLTDGSTLALDHDTDLALVGARGARLAAGGIVADVTRASEEVRFELPLGTVTSQGAKFALRTRADDATIDVTRGTLTLADRDDRHVRVNEGETGRLERGATPSVGAALALGETLGWSDETFGDEHPEVTTTRGLGELHARKPGQTEERTQAVTLASHTARVRIAGAVARTEVEEVFENSTDDVLEGIYRFPLPPGAQIERLALDVDGKLEEGAFVERDRAAAIFRGALVNAAPRAPRPLDDIVWVPGPWRDPALLEWQRGGRFELRVFPIPKHGSRRVLLAYTEVVTPTGGARRYTYPLAYDPSGTTRVRSFGLDVEVRGHDLTRGVRAQGYALDSVASSPGVSSLRFSARDFVPAGNLELEYALPGAASELTAWAYYDARRGQRTNGVSTAPNGMSTAPNGVDDTAPYVALALRPRLPRREHGSGRSVAVVVDASRSMLGEAYERASELATRIVRELDPSDRVVVLACALDCETLPGGPREPGSSAAAETRRFLRSITPEDASDVVGSVERALTALRSENGRARRVVYLGDGAPTAGQIRPGSVERAVARGVARVPASIVAVAIGSEADQATLGALARGGDGVMLPYGPGRTGAQMAYAVLGATYGSALSRVKVELPAGLYAVAPAAVPSIPAGGEAIVVARMNNLETRGEVVLKGMVGDEPFEQRYAVDLRASEGLGNAFVPRLYAAARLADLEHDGTPSAKAEAIALSTRFNVASRYTSLLVLESQAMLNAFGLDRASAPAGFSADEEAESTTAEGSEDVGDDAEAHAETTAAPAGLGGRALGLGSGSSTSAPSKKSKAFDDGDPFLSDFAARPAQGASVAPAPAPKAAMPAPAATSPFADDRRDAPVPEPSDPFVLRERPRRMIPMRRIWERQGEVFPDRRVPRVAEPDALAVAESEARDHADRRDAVKKLFTLLLEAGEIERAALVAEHWSEKEPLDPEAITARADVLAARGERGRATRVLGSALDARPQDIAAAKRLARLERWAGRPALGCRFSLAIAELRPADATLLADAVRCARETNDGAAADELLGLATQDVRDKAARLLAGPAPDDAALRGDLRAEASWRGDVDLDLAFVDPDGHRVSWLGAPTRGVISARDATSRSRETLALSGAKPGEYAIEIVSSSGGEGTAAGELVLSVAGSVRRIPFVLDGARARLGVVKISLHPRLVPL